MNNPAESQQHGSDEPSPEVASQTANDAAELAAIVEAKDAQRLKHGDAWDAAHSTNEDELHAQYNSPDKAQGTGSLADHSVLEAARRDAVASKDLRAEAAHLRQHLTSSQDSIKAAELDTQADQIENERLVKKRLSGESDELSGE